MGSGGREEEEEEDAVGGRGVGVGTHTSNHANAERGKMEESWWVMKQDETL